MDWSSSSLAATRNVAVVQLLLLHSSFLPVVIFSSKSLRVRFSRQALSLSLLTLTEKAAGWFNLSICLPVSDAFSSLRLQAANTIPELLSGEEDEDGDGLTERDGLAETDVEGDAPEALAL